MTNHTSVKLYAHKNWVTDKETFELDENGTRYGETPNLVIDAETSELAHLIAAAPELLEELKRLVDTYTYHVSREQFPAKESIRKALGNARRVIAKAEGRA